METSIIADANYQQLKMAFTFDELFEEKVIINALVDNTPYQDQFIFNPDSDFSDIKNALLSKHFKITSRTLKFSDSKSILAIFSLRTSKKSILAH